MHDDPMVPPPGPARPGDDDQPTGGMPDSGPSSGTKRFLELRDIPARIGPYRVVRELGHGGMGSVILAIRDGEEMKRHVAIKLVKRGMDTREILKRFEMERKVIGSLTHPNIARVLDAGATEDGRPYFVMEYIQGQPIDEYCDSQQLTTRERLVLFTKVCAAVHYAHQNLIVHRDIKPGNILVTPDGEPKLVDFGIAKMLNPDLVGLGMDTLPEARVMTPEYASPEQVKGEPISTASDIYSMGVLLYELLTGRRPYQLKSRVQAEIVRVVCEEEPERPSTAVTRPAEIVTSDGSTRTITAEEIGRRREMAPTKLRRTLSGDVDNIVLMAMRKSPRRRYASAEQFAHDIMNHLQDRPVIAAPETWRYHFGKFVVRNRVPVAAVVAVVASLVFGLTGTIWQWREARNQERVARVNAEAAQANEVRAVAAEKQTQRKYEQMRDMAGRFMADAESNIQRLEGATPARKILVETAKAVLEKFRVEGFDDPLLSRMLAGMLDRMGMVVGGGRNANEAKSREAVEYFRASIDLRRSLVSATPDDPVLAIELADGLEHLAFVLSRSGDPKGADAALAESDALASRALSATGAAASEARLTWVRATTARGDRLLQLDEPEKAGPVYRDALAAIQRLADEVPEGSPRRLDLRREVGVGHAKVGEWLDRSKQPEAALEEYRTSLKIRESLFDLAPQNATYRRDVIVMSEKVGRQLLELKRYDEAARALDRGLKAADDYAKIDPDDKRLPGDAARLYELAGDIARAQDRHDEALRLYSVFTSRLRELYGEKPALDPNRFYLARGVWKVGLAQLSLKQQDAGLDNLRLAVAEYALLADRNDNAVLRRAHAQAARTLGEKLVELGHGQEAVDALTAAAASYQRLGADARKQGREMTRDDSTELAETLASMSDIVRPKEPARALDYARRALDASPQPSERVRRTMQLAQEAAGGK